MNAPLHVDLAGPAHLHDISVVDRKVYPAPWSAALWRREVDRSADERCYVVASRGRRHVGHAGLVVVADEGHVTTVAVDPDHHGQRVGTVLMAVLSRRARALGLAALTLEVRVSNQPAQALYRRFGFAPAGARPGYYGDDGEDALIMWAHDIGTTEHGVLLDGIEQAVPGAVEFSPRLGRLLGAAVAPTEVRA